MQKPAEVKSPRAKWGQYHPAINHNSFQIVRSGHLLVSFYLSFYACVPFFEILFLCNVAGHSVLNFLVTQVKEVFHLIWSHMSAPVLRVDLFIISISLFQFCRVFSVNSNNTSVLSVPTILFHECQNPGSDECPRDSTYHLRSASIWMSNFLVNWTCGEGLLKYKNWLCLCGWIIWLEKGGTFFTTLVDNYALTMQRTSCFRLSHLNNDLISCYPIQCSNHTLRPH